MDSKKTRTDKQLPLLEGTPRGAMAGAPAESRTSNGHLYIAACVGNLASFAAGNTLTWSSPTISKLQADNAIESAQESWLGSLIALGAAVGPFLAGFIVDKVGRKPTLLLTAALFLISWAMITTALNLSEINYPLIYVARFIAGMSCGIVYTVIPMYVGEIAEDSVRGALGSLLAFFLVAGFLLEYIVGPYTTYVQLILASSIAPILFAVSFFFMPESPYYLLMKNDKAKALRALQWLRGASDANYVQKELTEMQSSVDETMAQKSGFLEIFATKGNIKALYLSCGLVAFQQLSGINVILFYSEPIFKSTGAGISASACTIIVGVVMLLSAGIAPPMAKCLGMKWLLIISAIGMAIFQGVLGIYFCLQIHGHDVTSLKFLPVGCVVAYIVVYCLGFGPLPWAVMGEMYPANIKAHASALTASFCWLLGFAITKSFSTIKDNLGPDVAFWLFAGFCIVALLFTIFLLPETKGLSLQEIQDVLNGRPVNRNTSGN